jgi:hypothetical protein
VEPFGSPCKLFASVALVTLVLGVLACGDTSEDATVATVGKHTKVSRATLNHWMELTLGGDYRPLFHASFPAGLVSDPPDYERCTRASAAIPEVPGKPKLTADQRRLKCRQLYPAIKEQALNSLLSSLWIREEARELGVSEPRGTEVATRLRAYIAHDFKSPAEFREVIAQQHRSLSDVRYTIQSTLLQSSIADRLKAQAAQLGGQSQAALYKLVVQNNAKWQARTSCSAGYRSSQCKQYRSGSEVKPPANIVLEYFRKGIG